jgi:NADH dehydrogenase/NADH:ubiquinone oxidoreductase subunit G
MSNEKVMRKEENINGDVDFSVFSFKTEFSSNKTNEKKKSTKFSIRKFLRFQMLNKEEIKESEDSEEQLSKSLKNIDIQRKLSVPILISEEEKMKEILKERGTHSFVVKVKEVSKNKENTSPRRIVIKP